MTRDLSKAPISRPRKTANRPGRPPRRAGAPDNRERILDVAEAMFAERGFHGVTIREVTREAKVDVALVYYYFAHKRDLFDAVFLRRAETLNVERLATIEAYLAQSAGKPTVEGLVAAFIEPMLDHWVNGGIAWKNYFALVAQVNNTPVWGGETMARFFNPVVDRLIDGLRLALPGADDQDLYWGYHFLSGALTLSFACTGRLDILSGGLCQSEDFASVRVRLPAYVAAGFRQLYEARVSAKQ